MPAAPERFTHCALYWGPVHVTEAQVRQGSGETETVSPWPRRRRRFDVFGVVQGVGFRPFVYVTTADLALSGFVGNTGAGVVIEVEGSSTSVGSRLAAG